MKTIDLLILQKQPAPAIYLYGVYRGNNAGGENFISATFDGEAYIQDLTTKEKIYLTSGEDVEWDIPFNEARNFKIVGKFSNLELNISEGGPQENNIQEILFNNVRCDNFTYKAFSSLQLGVVPHITGNSKVKNMNITIYGSGVSSSSQYIAGTFFTSLNQCNSLGTLKMEAGFVTPDNIAAASSKYYTLSALS